MGSVNVNITGDSSGVRRAGQDAANEIDKLKRKAKEASSAGSAGMKNFQITNFSNQLQDMVVQLQGGAKFTTIIAQQVPQMTSALGAGGAVLGGVVAVTAGLVSMGMAANDAFDKIKEGAKEAGKETRAALGQTDTGGLLQSFEKAHERSVQLNEEVKKLRTFTSVASGVAGSLVGGASYQEKEASILAIREGALRNEAIIKDRILEISARDVQLAEAKAAGNDVLVAKLTERANLEREIVAISKSGLDIATQQKLMDDARAKSAAVIAAAEQKRAKAQMDEAEKKQKAAGDAFEKSVDDALKTPQQRAKDRADARRRARARRSLIERDQDIEDQRNRNAGGSGLDAAGKFTQKDNIVGDHGMLRTLGVNMEKSANRLDGIHKSIQELAGKVAVTP